MRILGIETSCDETAAAVVENLPIGRQVGLKILSNVTASSAGIHSRTGGIIPEDAARKQIQAIIPVINLALKEAKINANELDSIAVTTGPGLIGSLLVGVETAKTLAYTWGKPIVPVNHLVAHIYANWLGKNTLPKFPALALIVSGGHTDIVLIENHGKIKWIGGTRDDAAGEAFDKTARLLGIQYPGGPTLSSIADKFLHTNPKLKLNLFPRPMLDQDNLECSFSGLKTAVVNKVSEIYGNKMKLSDYKEISTNKSVLKNTPWIAAEIQEAIVDILVAKTSKAVEKYKPKSLLISGGVAANNRLRTKLKQALKTKAPEVHLFVPEPALCTDNASAIASAAFFNNHTTPWEKVAADPELTITS